MRIAVTKYGVLSAAIVLAASACAKKEAGPSDSSTVSTTAATVATPATRKFGNPQPYNLQDEDDALIVVNVELADGAPIVNSSTPPSADELIGKILNTSTKKEKRYKFKSQTEDEYFLYANAGPAGSATTWRITEEKTGTTVETPFRHGTFGKCEGTHPTTAANLGFKWCPSFGPKPAASKKTSTMKKSSMMSAGLFGRVFNRVLAYFQRGDTAMMPPPGGTDDPGWVACTDGCCTLGNGTSDQ